MSNITFKGIFEEIKKAKNILILAHQKPDGDAIGSMLALKMICEKLNIPADPVVTDVPEFVELIPGHEKLLREINGKYDLTIFVDISSIKQLGSFEYIYQEDRKIIIIDHHKIDVEDSILHYIDSSFSSTTMMLYEFMKENNLDIDLDIATCLYIGLITDTAGFVNRNTDSEVFKVASELLEYGINHNETYKNFINPDYTLDYLMLEKEVINNLEIINKNIAFSYLNYDVISKYSDYETPKEFVGLGRKLVGVEVSVLIIEEEPDNYRVSIRSKKYLDVSIIAKKFGGGGHKYASGIRFSGNYDEMKDKILTEIARELK